MNSREVKQLLSKENIVPRKRFGQNFLCGDEEGFGTAKKIVDSAQIELGENVLEIGPGLGALTREIKRFNCRLIVVEIDRGLARYLKEGMFFENPDSVISADICELSPEGLFENGEKFVVISNAPYSRSTEILEWILDNGNRVSRAVILLQEEFARRLSAEPGTKDYGRLSIFCQMYADVEGTFTVSGSEFYPITPVRSALIILKPLPSPREVVSDKLLFETVVKAAFGMRRKTLLNCLLSGKLIEDKRSGAALLKTLGIDERQRGESLSLAQFAQLAERLKELSLGKTASSFTTRCS